MQNFQKFCALKIIVYTVITISIPYSRKAWQTSSAFGQTKIHQMIQSNNKLAKPILAKIILQ